MNEKNEALLSLAFEVEGLIVLLERRADRTPAEVVELLKEKVAKLKSSVDVLSCVKSYSSVAASAEYEERQDAAGKPSQPVAAVVEPEPKPVVKIAEPKPVVKIPVPEPESKKPQEPIITPIVEKISQRQAPEKYVAPVKDIETLGDMHKVFTLNDKFRFRRELFNNNDTDFQDALNVVKTMSSLDDAKDYFYNDLCWDSENEDVKDFIEVISGYFSH